LAKLGLREGCCMVKLCLRYKLRDSMGREYGGRWGWLYFSNRFYL
jgi:hypothetical protein